MKIFKDFSYRLLRTFALTTGFCGALLLYMAVKASHGNTYFLIWSIVMILFTIYFAFLSWQNYKHRPISMAGKGEVYGGLCPKCGEMIKVGEKHCPQCGESIK